MRVTVGKRLEFLYLYSFAFLFFNFFRLLLAHSSFSCLTVWVTALSHKAKDYLSVFKEQKVSVSISLPTVYSLQFIIPEDECN